MSAKGLQADISRPAGKVAEVPGADLFLCPGLDARKYGQLARAKRTLL